MKKTTPMFVAYKGDKCLGIGTRKEVAKLLDINEDTVYFYSSKAYKKSIEGQNNRIIIVRVED